MGYALAPNNPAKRPFRMTVGKNYLSDLVDGMLAMGQFGVGAKTVYFCDGNAGNDYNSGKGGWENSFKTLAAALAASNADIASNSLGWAARNVIFCRGDYFEEDLVLLAQKTDVVGCGSWDQFPYAGLAGNHVPTGTTCSYGTRFFNFQFKGDPTTGGDIWTLDNTVSGLSFYNCRFDSTSTTAATGAIVATASPFLHVEGCEFMGAFSDAVIEFGAGDSRGARIIGNIIEGANNGIDFNSSFSDSSGATQAAAIVADNIIKAALLTVNDDSDLVHVIGNTLISLTADIADAVDLNVALAAKNYLTTTVLNTIYPILDTTT